MFVNLISSAQYNVAKEKDMFVYKLPFKLMFHKGWFLATVRPVLVCQSQRLYFNNCAVLSTIEYIYISNGLKKILIVLKNTTSLSVLSMYSSHIVPFHTTQHILVIYLYYRKITCSGIKYSAFKQKSQYF